MNSFKKVDSPTRLGAATFLGSYYGISPDEKALLGNP